MLYFAAGSAAEFNLFTIWRSLPNFLDYMFETLPTLHVSALFADVLHHLALAAEFSRLHV
ncbi:hypothetical protein UA70_17050 [Raoultella planticola]|nr:hypothetical protein UA70_17050 [Raoultella planticola]